MNVNLPVEAIAVSIMLGAAMPAIVGWLLLRAIGGVDRQLSTLTLKVEQLASQDTKILVQLENLRARVTHLEFLVSGRAQIPDSFGAPE